LLDLNSELLEVKESVEDEVMEVFDDLNEKVQDGIDKFDTYNSILENY
jgi:FPC/CPF motif-containing protein YcgG